MTFQTPYFMYIFGAYGLTLLGLGVFLAMTLLSWKRSKRWIDEA